MATATLHYYLVDHPLISNYAWFPRSTPGASPTFVVVTVATYLLLTLTLPRLRLQSPPQLLLRSISTVHNLILTLLSLTMAVGSTLAAIHQTPPHLPTWPICFPKPTDPKGPTFFWAHVFYFSKLLEFVDTLLIILNSSSRRRLSFLHVYHHAVVVVMCYLWLDTCQSLFPVALVTNATVHVVMYGYYLLSGLGYRPRWKRLVTDFQILQFVFSFLVSFWMLKLHFERGCEGVWGWAFNAVFNASLLWLFVDFHRKNYESKRKQRISSSDGEKDKLS